MSGVRVQVAGNLVALLIKEVHDSSGAHLEIWNWENGPRFSVCFILSCPITSLDYSLQCAMTRVSGIDDFTFLTHDSFLLVRPTGRFEVYTFIEPVKISTAPILRATYAFPALSDGYMYWYISMSSNPAPGYVPRSRSDKDCNNATPAGSRQMYYPKPDERIHACCLYIFNPTIEENQHHHDVHSFVFFLNIQTLLNPPAAWLVKKPSTLFYNSHPATTLTARRTARNTVTGLESSFESNANAQGSSNFPINPSPIDNPMAPPNSPILSASSSSLFPSIYPPFPTFTHFPIHTSNPIPPVNSPSSVSSPSMSPSFRSESSRTSITSLAPVVNFPWEVWGPQSTRWFEECISTDWQHAIYGLRTVESVGIPERRDRNSTATTLSSPPVQPSNPTISNGTSVTHKSVPIQATEGSSSAMTVDATEEPIIPDDKPISTQEDSGHESEESEDGSVANRKRNLLRIRDFNPYSFTKISEPFGSETPNEKGKRRARWRTPRLVTESSKTFVKGVFTRDIESSLPYMEVVSEDTFEVTDVMMDDCRLLLLKVGPFSLLL